MLITQAQSAENPRDQMVLYTQQFALVYELGKIVIGLLEEVTLEGTETLDRIKNENQARVTSRLANVNKNIQDIQDQVNRGLLDPTTGSATERALANLINANQEILTQWDTLLDAANAQNEFLSELPTYVAKVRTKMEVARLSLETLRDTQSLLLVMDSVNALEGIALNYSEMPILPLDRETIHQLLGIASPDSTN